MAKTITVNLTDEQYETLDRLGLVASGVHVYNEGEEAFVYEVDDLEVVLWVVQPDGNAHQERLEYDQWVKYDEDGIPTDNEIVEDDD